MAGMSEKPNGNGSGGDPSFHAFLCQWAAQASTIAMGMVIPALIGFGLDRLLGTVVLFAIFGAILGMVLGFWQLIRIANPSNPQIPSTGSSGVDKSPDTGDNEAV